MKKDGRKYLRRAARVSTCSPEARKVLLRRLTRQLEALEKDAPEADYKAVCSALGSPEEAVNAYEAALPETDRQKACRHRKCVRIAAAAAVCAVLAALIIVFWFLWESKETFYILPTLTIYSSEEEPDYWDEVENGETVVVYPDDTDMDRYIVENSSEPVE